MPLLPRIVRNFRGVLALMACVLGQVVRAEPSGEMFSLQLRSRVETAPGTGRFHTVFREESWRAAETAVVVCDMWDLHHCLNATRRGAEMAPRMNELLKHFRSRGAVIIHAPSDCLDFYREHPARLRTLQVPRAANPPAEIGQACQRIPAEERGTYPIDQSDGGEDDDLEEHQQWAEKLAAMGRNPRAPWVRQTELLEIDGQRDFISDNGAEVWNILEQRGIRNVVLVGVHTNMCVLGRSFGLRNMVRYGKNTVLVRDMTDTMYNPAAAPYVSHFTGTDLIVEHIEKWVCSTITSDQLLGGKPFRFALDKRPHVVIACSEPEYRTQETLPVFALQQLGKAFRVTFVFGDEQNGNDLPGLVPALEDADALLVSIRRRALPTDQLDAIRRYVDSGRPIVGIRTANHAFSLRGAPPPAGHEVWERWDQEVFGGNYTGHHGDGPAVQISVAKGAEEHPLLHGVELGQLAGRGSLYKVSPLAASATPLLLGSIPNQPEEPILWTNTTAAGGRVCYTSLGHVGDFAQPAFQQLLLNAITWSATSAAIGR